MNWKNIEKKLGAKKPCKTPNPWSKEGLKLEINLSKGTILQKNREIELLKSVISEYKRGNSDLTRENERLLIGKTPKFTANLIEERRLLTERVRIAEDIQRQQEYTIRSLKLQIEPFELNEGNYE